MARYCSCRYCRSLVNCNIPPIYVDMALISERKDSIKELIFFFPAIITSFAFFQGDTTLAPAIVRESLTIVNWLCFIVLLLLSRSFKVVNAPLMVAIVIQFIFRNFHTSSGLEWHMSGVLMIFLICLFCLFKKNEYGVLYAWFRKVLIAMSAYGIISELSFLLGLGLPYTIVDFYDEERVASYANYYLSYLYLDAEGLRLCGLFNEAGFLGTILGLVLIVERFNLKKVGNCFMLVAGVFTLSLAFFSLVLIGLGLMVIANKKTLIYIFIALSIAIVGVAVVDKDNIVLSYIQEKTTYDAENRSIGGHSREEDAFQKIYDDFNKSGNFFFGYGTGYCVQKGIHQTNSIRMSFVEWGYLGTFIVYGLFLWAAFLTARGSNNAKWYMLCFILSILQRPNVFSTPYIIVLFGGIQYILLQESEENNINKEKLHSRKTMVIK